MPRITFIEASGEEHVVEAQNGLNVMEAAVWNDVPGIEAICGGACVCGTCHSYIDAAWRQKLEARSPEERAILDDHPDATPDSRLCCQIKVTPALDGLVVRLPGRQRG